ncbi:MAG: FHA domain-containing protein [bacterium]
MLNIITHIMLIGFSFSTITSSICKGLPDKPINHFPLQAQILADKVYDRLKTLFPEEKTYRINLEFSNFDTLSVSDSGALKTEFSAALTKYPDIAVQLNEADQKQILKKLKDFCTVATNCSIGRIFTTLKSPNYYLKCEWVPKQANNTGSIECTTDSIFGHNHFVVSDDVYLPAYIAQLEAKQRFKCYGISIGSILAIIFLLTFTTLKTVSVVREKAVQKKITEISDGIDQLITNGEYKRANELIVHYIKLAPANPRLKDLQAKLKSSVKEQDTDDPEFAQRRLKIRTNIEQIVADINDLMKRGRYVDAEEQINYNLGIDPANPELKGLKGTLDALLASMGVKTAKEAVEVLLKKQALYNKAKSLAQAGDIKGSKKALAEYNQFASEIPSPHTGTTAISSSAQSTKQYALASGEEAKSEIDEIIQAKYQSFLAGVNQSLMQGRRSEAVGLIDKYLREYSDEQNQELIKLYKMLQKYGESKKLYMVSESFEKVLHLYFTNTLTIGRDESNDLIPDSMGVSRKHLKLHISEDKVLIEDVGSKFGTFINDKKIEPHKPVELAHLDHILLADNFPFDVKITSNVNTGEVENAIFVMKDFTVILIKDSLRIGFAESGVVLKGKGEGGFTIKSYSGMGFIVDTDERVTIDNMHYNGPVPLLPETNITVSDAIISTLL